MPPARPPATGLRAVVERNSAALLVLLTAQPRWLLPVVSAALLGGVLFAPPAMSLVCSAVLLLVVGWLSYLSWPAVEGRSRLVRVAVLGLLVVLAVQSAAG